VSRRNARRSEQRRAPAVLQEVRKLVVMAATIARLAAASGKPLMNRRSISQHLQASNLGSRNGLDDACDTLLEQKV
jgi:hypothetical protein